jgi:hypothetical protein
LVGFNNETEVKERMSPGDQPVSGKNTISFIEYSKKKMTEG